MVRAFNHFGGTCWRLRRWTARRHFEGVDCRLAWFDSLGTYDARDLLSPRFDCWRTSWGSLSWHDECAWQRLQCDRLDRRDRYTDSCDAHSRPVLLHRGVDPKRGPWERSSDLARCGYH